MSHYILVVDDEDAIRYALCRQLRSLGYEVGEADCGPRALDMIAERKPDLVLLDIIMAPMSGWRVLETLARNPETSHIRVVILSSLGTDEHETYGWLLGCDWYEVKDKPLQLEDIGLVVGRLLAIDPEEEQRALRETEGSSEEGSGS